MITQNLHEFPRKRRNAARRIAIFLLVYAILGFLVLPPIIRAVAVKQLSKQLNREVTIGKVKLNPFVLSITIRNLLIKDQDGQPFVSWDEVYVNFQLSSFLGHAWVFKEVSTTRPFIRAQMNKDYTLNFSDLITRFSTNAPPKEPSKPPALRIDHLRIVGATASLTDLTPRTPFKRVLGPLDVTLDHFRTDPESRNPYSFSGTTDAGEKFSWSGYFYLAPLRSEGDLSFGNLSLNKYAPLYQDLVRFEIKDGVVDLRSTYRFEWSASNQVASVTNASFTLHSFKLAEPGSAANIVELPEFSVAEASLDVTGRRAEIGSVSATGARLALHRDKSDAINIVEVSKPAADMTNAPGGILLLLRSVTNAVAMLLNSTNAWAATLHDVEMRDCAVNLADDANARPVRLDLDHITMTAKNISNVPGSNLTAALSLRWNTNGTIKADVSASFLPPTADIHLALDGLELGPLDPYLESKVNLFILGSKLGMDGDIHLRTLLGELPAVTFHGSVHLDDFATVDGVLGEDLVKWRSVRVSDIDANLNPPMVSIRQVSVDDAYARVLIETNHTINLLAALSQTGDTNAPSREPQRAGGKPRPASPPPAALPNISIGAIVISNAEVRFTDRSVTPNVNMAIQQAGGTISGLSSEDLRHADVKLHARVDNIGPVEITGTINPFSEHMTNEVKIAVNDVDLTPTSPYSGKFAGYRIAKGKLSLSLAYHLHGRSLKSENLITLDQFTFGDRVDSPDATKLPVRLAIAILKDRSGKIELDVPVEGSLDDPQFRLHKVVVRAVVNLLTKVATSPFSLLGAALGGKGEEINYQDFAPGSSELEAAAREKLDALVKALYERPALQLEIAGSVDPEADRDGLRRVELEKRIRRAKWQSLRKSAREATTPEQVSVEPQERADWIKTFYNDALSKGQLVPTGADTTTSVRAANAENKTSGETAKPSEAEKGATSLMENTVTLRPSTAPVNPAAPGGTDSIELAVLNSIPITDSDFEALASNRAKAVRAYILGTGKVEPERVFLTESQPGGVKSQGARTYLQLR